MDSSCRCTLNVGGQIFTTTIDTLRSLPNTRLGRLAQDETLTNQKDAELFFDRNPEIMNNLLDLYRTGDLHLPSSLCGHSVERELKFWEIPCEMVKECCYGRLKKHQDDAKITAEIDKFLTNRYDTPAEIQELSSWNKIWLIMERPNLSRLSKVNQYRNNISLLLLLPPPPPLSLPLSLTMINMFYCTCARVCVYRRSS